MTLRRKVDALRGSPCRVVLLMARLMLFNSETQFRLPKFCVDAFKKISEWELPSCLTRLHMHATVISPF